MALIICGHQRSGTTLLQRLCDRHPDIAVTNEFGNFFDLNESFSTYGRYILKLWWRAGNRSFFSPHMCWGGSGFSMVENTGKPVHPAFDAGQKLLRVHMLQNLWFVTRYLLGIPRDHWSNVDASTIEAALNGIFPGARIVGDKHPDYVFALDRLAQSAGLLCLVIYRDPRDMANSVLKAYSAWGKWWGPELAQAESIAERWVHTIELVERNSDKIYAIRYEDLVTDPCSVLAELAEWLGVNPQGFRLDMVRSSSLGKYREGLSKEEVTDIIRVAGPKMEQLGYEI